jgi:hypothetical protein
MQEVQIPGILQNRPGLVRMLGLVRAMMDMVFLATFGLLRAMIIWLDTVFWCWALGVGVGFCVKLLTDFGARYLCHRGIPTSDWIFSHLPHLSLTSCPHHSPTITIISFSFANVCTVSYCSYSTTPHNHFRGISIWPQPTATYHRLLLGY